MKAGALEVLGTSARPTHSIPASRKGCLVIMSSAKFSGKVKDLADRANRGAVEDIDYIMSHLTPTVTLSMTRFVDYALSLVESDAGIGQIEYYLFNGTQIQRNYCSLFFNRRGDWPIVREAYERGLIDEIQAYAR